MAQFIHPGHSTYVDPRSGETKDIYALSKDIDLAGSTKDDELVYLCLIRQRYWQATVISAGFIPLMLVMYWGYILL